MKKITSFGLILGSLLLIACSSDNPSPAQESPEISTQKEVDQTKHIQKNEEQKLQEDKEADAKRLSAEQEALNKQNVDLCDKIEDENQKYSCRYNVIVAEAIESKDPSLCDKIGETEAINNCKAVASGD